MTRLPLLVVAVAIAVSACTGSSSSSNDDTAASTAAPPSTTETPPRAPATGDAPVGRIVAVRDDAEIVVFEPGGGPGEIVNDAGGTVVARQPIWSPDGTRVAWAALDAEAQASVRWRRLDGGAVETAETPSLAFYLAYVDDGADLAWLGNAPDGVGLSLVDLTSGTSRLLDVDVPYYVDAVAGGPLVAHVGGTQLQTITDGDPIRIGEGTPAMQAPEVAPDGTIVALLEDRDDRTIADPAPGPVLVSAETDELRLVRLSPAGEELDELARLPLQALAFDLDPTGARVALWRRDLRGVTTVDVIDLATGGIETVVDDGGVAAAWSPDGSRLAVLLIEPEGLARWSVWSGDGSVAGEPFRPTETFVRDYLPFWDQYLRSSSPWSPDSEALTHAATGTGGPVVLVQPVDGSEAIELGPGEMSWWSPAVGRSPSTPVRP